MAAAAVQGAGLTIGSNLGSVCEPFLHVPTPKGEIKDKSSHNSFENVCIM